MKRASLSQTNGDAVGTSDSSDDLVDLISGQHTGRAREHSVRDLADPGSAENFC